MTATRDTDTEGAVDRIARNSTVANLAEVLAQGRPDIAGILGDAILDAGASDRCGEYLAGRLCGNNPVAVKAVQMYGLRPVLSWTEKDVAIAPGVDMRFCWIPPGAATLGSSASEAGRWNDEPEHGFETPGFWLGKYPVTQGEWAAVMGSNPSEFKRWDRYPVESVFWNDCQEFIKRLSVDATLPHEDQWEYACRGGMGNDRPFYFGQFADGNFNCHDKEQLGHPTPVGDYEDSTPHPWGLCDMHGNVWEWCENLYNRASARVLRGGGWGNVGGSGRSANRSRVGPLGRDDSLGFRVTLVPAEVISIPQLRANQPRTSCHLGETGW